MPHALNTARLGVCAVLATGALLVSEPASAGDLSPPPCRPMKSPFVRFETPTAGREPKGFIEIVRHVQAELALKGIQVCVEGDGEPIAIVQVLSTTPGSVEVVVDVRDAITRKRVSRILDLRTIPPDARPLAVAVGTDELLLASWVEVALDDGDEASAAKPPEEVRAVVTSSLQSAPSAAVGAAFAFESYQGGQAFSGIDVRGALFASDRTRLTLRLGMRRGLRDESRNGTLSANAWLVGGGLRVALSAPGTVFGVDALARADVLRIAYAPEASGQAVARPTEATAVVAMAGLAARIQPIHVLEISLEGALGTPLRPVHATDTGNDVAAVADLALAVGGEIAVLF